MIYKTFQWGQELFYLRNSILRILKNYEVFCYLDSCGFYNQAPINTTPQYHNFDLLAGAGAKNQLIKQAGNGFENLKSWISANDEWCFGHLGYDLKNELESLSSQNTDSQNFDDLHFFVPEWVITLQKEELAIYADTEEAIYSLWEEIKLRKEESQDNNFSHSSPELQNVINKEQYQERVNELIQEIIEGNIYEINFCQEFYTNDIEVDPFELFQNLIQISPTPFSCFYKYHEHYIVSASMERFMKKTGNKLISQPIKGTIKRGNTEKEDKELQAQLQKDPKERAENVMIVDLVRNDLAKSSYPGTVKVDELFGLYPFPTVHQMISTVSGELDENVHFIDALKNAFPMGSMTGAPKVSAMKFIEKYESFKRGVFSGAIGYITPWHDFDFNVIIRSFLYNETSQFLSIPVGSAITFDAKPEQEYEECLVKISKLTEALK